MNHFYITLPSNSSRDYYPNNTVACYTTKLADKVELDGAWEVGLAQITVPFAVDNIAHGQYYYYDLFISDEFFRKFALPPIYLKQVHKLIEVMHIVQEVDPLFIEFSFSYKANRVLVRTIGTAYSNISVQFSPDLAHMLGFKEDRKYSDAEAEHPPSMTLGDVYSMYVYCDILEHVAVGDTKASLLRIVDKPRRSDGNVHQTFNPILFVPLQKKNFDTVEINIMTDTGVPVPFRFGKSAVVLEFRRVVHPLLAI